MRVDNADIMATLLKLKAEVEHARKSSIKLVFSGASESHLLAEDIGNPPTLSKCLLPANWAERSKSERWSYPYLFQAIPSNLGQPQNVCVLLSFDSALR